MGWQWVAWLAGSGKWRQVAAGGGRWWQVVAAEGGRGRKRREDSREWQGGGKQGGKGWLEAVWWGCMGALPVANALWLAACTHSTTFAVPALFPALLIII